MDIKPANILLEDSSCRVAKIADLGISRCLVEGSLSTITSRGVLAMHRNSRNQNCMQGILHRARVCQSVRIRLCNLDSGVAECALLCSLQAGACNDSARRVTWG